MYRRCVKTGCSGCFIRATSPSTGWWTVHRLSSQRSYRRACGFPLYKYKLRPLVARERSRALQTTNTGNPTSVEFCRHFHSEGPYFCIGEAFALRMAPKMILEFDNSYPKHHEINFTSPQRAAHISDPTSAPHVNIWVERVKPIFGRVNITSHDTRLPPRRYGSHQIGPTKSQLSHCHLSSQRCALRTGFTKFVHN